MQPEPKTRYQLEEFDKGDSRFFPIEHFDGLGSIPSNLVNNAIAIYRRRHNPDARFKVRTQKDEAGRKLGVLIERIA